ncbi:MAG: hypothetical protein Q9179_002478 [Wetmoreana sp. 5 TL-2023]
MPFYCFLHVLNSPTNVALPTSTKDDRVHDLLIEPAQLAAWAPAFTVSYLLPTILVTLPLPTYTSWTVLQYIIAWWEFYPVPFKVLQIVFARYVFGKTFTPSASSSTSAASKKHTSQSQSLAVKKAETLYLLRQTYLFAASVAIITHIITLTLSLSTYFFPSLFSTAALTKISLSPRNVFLPVSPFYHTPIKDLGEGLYHFLVWNMTVSNIAPFVWGLLQLRAAVERNGRGHGWEGWGWAWAKVVGLVLIGGPSAAAVWCAWRKDELVLGDGKPKSKQTD